jgi:hypothetical protein
LKDNETINSYILEESHNVKFDLFNDIQENLRRTKENSLRSREINLWSRSSREKTKKRWVKEVGYFEEYLKDNHFPTMSEWDHYAKPRGYYCANAFTTRLHGKWEDVAHYFNHDFVRKKVYSEEELIHILRRAVKEIGKEKLTQVDYNKWAEGKSVPLASHFARRLGRGLWRKVLDKVELSNKCRISDEELIGILQRACKEYGKRSLTLNDYKHWAKENEGVPTAYYISKRLGRGLWIGALKRAGIHRNHD